MANKCEKRISCRYEIRCRSREIKIDDDNRGGAESGRQNGEEKKKRHYILQGISLLECGKLLEA